MRLACIFLVICSAALVSCAATQPAKTAQPVKGAETHTPQSKSASATTSLSARPLTQETIGKIVQSHFEELQTCYETTLASDNSLAGIVELELTIARDGTIQEGKLLKDGLGSAELNLCLVKKMVDWTFPPHTDEEVTIQFPFAFSPKR